MMRLIKDFEVAIGLEHQDHVFATHIVHKEVSENWNHITRSLPHEKLSLSLEHPRLPSEHERVYKELMLFCNLFRHQVVDRENQCFCHCVLEKFQSGLVNEGDFHGLPQIDVSHEQAFLLVI